MSAFSQEETFWQSDGSGSETISMTVRIEYHRHEFGGYLGNVGLNNINLTGRLWRS
jgi:hypothetical protein